MDTTHTDKDKLIADLQEQIDAYHVRVQNDALRMTRLQDEIDRYVQADGVQA